MCGQAGIIRMGGQPISIDVLKLLLVGNEHRGNDATGMAISQNDGTVVVCKDDEPAWRFVTQKTFSEFLEEHLKEDSWAVLLHTRAATKGSPRDNKNNHPMYNGAGAIVHNGVIHNDDFLFRESGLDRGAETDSDIIRAFVDRYGITQECITNLNKISGSAAGAAIHPEFPKRLMLYRTGSPMILASNDDFLVWSSEKTTIHRAMRPWIERFGMHFQEQRPEIAFSPFPDDSAWLVGENGLEYHSRFKGLHGQYQEPHRRTYEGYKDRQTRWDGEEERTKRLQKLSDSSQNEKFPKDKWDDAYCTKCQREWFIPKGTQPGNFHCDKKKKGCGGKLTYKPMIHVVN